MRLTGTGWSSVLPGKIADAVVAARADRGFRALAHRHSQGKGNFQAHAWVERDGLSLNEPDEHHRHYAAFDAAFPRYGLK